MPFGVSEHLGASFSWFQDSHKSDKTGPLAGVPYDGANSNYWDLYHFPAEPTDKSTWYTKDPRWQQRWYAVVKELVDNYQPDLLYSDGPVVFGNEVGLSQVANLYNLSAAKNGGKALAVYNCKEEGDGKWVRDFERGVGGGISPHPWQTDTSIGDWYYNRHWKYQPLRWTVHMLVDIVSKNGNLLLNVVQRPDGTLDPEVEVLLNEMADWMAANGEGIYGTRPWQVFGEGPMRAKGGAFKENFHIHREGHPVHHERTGSFTPSRSACPKTGACSSNRSRRRRAATRSSAWNCWAARANSSSSRARKVCWSSCPPES